MVMHGAIEDELYSAKTCQDCSEEVNEHKKSFCNSNKIYNKKV